MLRRLWMAWAMGVATFKPSEFQVFKLVHERAPQGS